MLDKNTALQNKTCFTNKVLNIDKRCIFPQAALSKSTSTLTVRAVRWWSLKKHLNLLNHCLNLFFILELNFLIFRKKLFCPVSGVDSVIMICVSTSFYRTLA